MGTLMMDTCSRTCPKPAWPQLCQGPTAPAGGGSAQPWEHRDEHWDIPGDSWWWLCSGEGEGGTHAGPSQLSVGWDEPWQSSPKSTQLQVPLPAALQEELGDTVSPLLQPSHIPRALAARAAHWGHCWTPAVPSSSPTEQGNPQGHRSKDLQCQHAHPSSPNWAGTGTAPLGAACAAEGVLLGKAGGRYGCSQHLLCPVCSHAAPGSPCMAQHLPVALLGTQAQMGQDPAPVQWETSA